MRVSKFQSVHGNALLISLGFMVMLSGFVAAALTMTNGSTRMARREHDVANLEAASDGAVEYYYARWKKWIVDHGLNAPKTAALSGFAVPSTSLNSTFGTLGITFSNRSIEFVDPWGNPFNSSNPIAEYQSPGYEDTVISKGGFKEFNLKNYPGWIGNSFYYRVGTKAKGPSGAEVAVRRYFQLAHVPLFQVAIFFEEDLELHPGDDMIISGKVHTNQDAWCMAYQTLKFLDRVSYAGKYTEAVSPERKGMMPPDPNKLPVWKDGKASDQSTTKANQLSQVDRIEPFGTAPAQAFNSSDNNPNNDSFHELIEPPVTTGSPVPADPEAIAERRLYNKADIKIKIDSSKPSTDPNRVVVTYRDGSSPLNANTVTKFKSSVASTSTNLYDRREAGNLKTTNVDVSLLNTALTELQRSNGSNPEGKSFNGVVYVWDAATGKNAIRFNNGAELVQDLTLVSEDPVYLQGDFNTGGGAGASHNVNSVPSNSGGNPNGTDATYTNSYAHKSAAVIGDVVTILSNNWNDANASKALSSRTASHTTVNAAVVSGYLPTDYKNNNAAGGGAHNLVRFLENWSGKDFSYLGSMVQIYVTEKTSGLWDTGQIYSPPGRPWSYDPQFNTQQPPGFLQGTVYSRGRWERPDPAALTAGN